jgi:hypothetical protein
LVDGDSVLLAASWVRDHQNPFEWVEEFSAEIQENYDSYYKAVLLSVLRLDATRKKRCLTILFKFKKFNIKQAIFL